MREPSMGKMGVRYMYSRLAVDHHWGTPIESFLCMLHYSGHSTTNERLLSAGAAQHVPCRPSSAPASSRMSLTNSLTRGSLHVTHPHSTPSAAAAGGAASPAARHRAYVPHLRSPIAKAVVLFQRGAQPARPQLHATASSRFPRCTAATAGGFPHDARVGCPCTWCSARRHCSADRPWPGGHWS